MSFARGLALRLLRLAGPEFKSRWKWNLTIPDMEASLRNMQRVGFNPKVALDIGAYVGEWTRMIKRIFPQMQVMMFEPQPGLHKGLDLLTQQLPGVQYTGTLLGREKKSDVPFRLLKTGSSIYATERHPDAPMVSLAMTTLDEATKGTPFATPDLIKIDVQGAELEVFAGGGQALAAAEAVIMEVSLHREYENSPLMPEVIRYMNDHGFQPYDICTIWRNTPTRSADQADVIFVKHASPLLHSRHYVAGAR